MRLDRPKGHFRLPEHAHDDEKRLSNSRYCIIRASEANRTAASGGLAADAAGTRDVAVRVEPRVVFDGSEPFSAALLLFGDGVAGQVGAVAGAVLLVDLARALIARTRCQGE